MSNLSQFTFVTIKVNQTKNIIFKEKIEKIYKSHSI